jgi:hypothetical protein
VVGASIGATTAVLAMTDRVGRRLRAAVALSPADAASLFELQGSGRYRPHDVLFVSDRAEAQSVENLWPGAVRSRRLQSSTDGHGVALLGDRGVHEALLGWLRSHLTA